MKKRARKEVLLAKKQQKKNIDNFIFMWDSYRQFYFSFKNDG